MDVAYVYMGQESLVCNLEFEADRENEAAAVSTNAWIQAHSLQLALAL